MTKLVDRQGNTVDVPSKDVSRALASGQFGLPGNSISEGKVRVVTPDGRYGTVPVNNITRALQSGLRLEEEDDALQRTHGDKEGQAFATGLARGATMGLSDLALTKTGLVSPEHLDKLQRANPVASTAGSVTGAVGSMLLPGGQAGTVVKLLRGVSAPTRAVAGLGQAVGRTAESALLKFLTEKGVDKALVKAGQLAVGETAKGSIAQQALAKGVAFTAAGATEGTLFGVSQAIDEAVLGDPRTAAELLTAHVGPAAIASGMIGGIFGASSVPIGKSLAAMTKTAHSKITSALEGAENVAKRLDRKALFEKVGVTNLKPLIRKKGGIYKGESKWLTEAENVLRNEKTMDGLPLIADDIENTSTRLRDTVDMHGARIGTIRQKADEFAKKAELSPKELPGLDRVVAKLASKLGTLKYMPSHLPAQRELKRHIQVWRGKGPQSFEKIQELANSLSKSFNRRAEEGSADWAKQFIWRAVRNESDTSLEALLKKHGNNLGEKVFEQYEDSKRVYHALTELADKSEEAALVGVRSNSVIGRMVQYAAENTLWRMAWGTSAQAAIPFAVAAAGVRALTKVGGAVEQLASKAAKLRALQTQLNSGADRVTKVVERFASKRGGEITRLGTSRLLSDITGKRDRKVAARELADQLHRYAADPARLANGITASFVGLDGAAPNISSSASEQVARLMMSLQTMAPMPPADVLLQPSARKWEVDDLAASAFASATAGHLDPIGVIEEALDGSPDIMAIRLVKQH